MTALGSLHEMKPRGKAQVFAKDTVGFQLLSPPLVQCAPAAAAADHPQVHLTFRRRCALMLDAKRTYSASEAVWLARAPSFTHGERRKQGATGICTAYNIVFFWVIR